jgi:hypothetical protein
MFNQATISMSIGKLLAAAAAAAPMAASAAPAVPQQAANVIKRVHAASAKKDWAALRAEMLSEFIWSFGGDAGAEQAIKAWRADPKLLAQLHRITGQRCEPTTGGIIQCPNSAGVGYRAGFRKTPAGWRMIYFVAGD